MELSAQYAYKVYKEQSFTAAAKGLYISQPALSNAISRLEKELGFQIFDRSKFPLALTTEGRIYIETLEEIFESENNMHRRLKELSNMSSGKITIGGSSYSSYYIMSEICGEFYKKYPDIKVTLDIGNIGGSNILSEKLKTGEIDLIITYSNNNRNYIVEPLLTERLIIAMHKNMAKANNLLPFSLTFQEILSGDYREKEIEDLSVFKNINFIKFPNSSITSKSMIHILGDFNSAPYTIENARHSGMHNNLMMAEIGAVMTTDYIISKTNNKFDDIVYFVPKHKESYRKEYIAINHNSIDNPIVKNFIKTAKEIFNRY